jgi:hypothetical protein
MARMAFLRPTPLALILLGGVGFERNLGGRGGGTEIPFLLLALSIPQLGLQLLDLLGQGIDLTLLLKTALTVSSHSAPAENLSSKGIPRQTLNSG